MSDQPVPSRDHISVIEEVAAAASEVAGIVARSIGPAGTHCLYEDESLGMADGAAILKKLSPSHPAGRAMQKLGQAQARRMGDGVKTTVILAAALIEAGADHIQQGTVPCELASQITDAATAVIEQMETKVREIDGPNDPVLEDVALAAARGEAGIARGVLELVHTTDYERISDDEQFCLPDHLHTHWQAQDHLIEGLFVDGKRASRRMPEVVEDTEMLLVDDDLDMQHFPSQMLQTESGSDRYWETQESFTENLRRLRQMGINAILVSGRIADIALQRLTEGGVFTVSDLGSEAVWRIAQFTGATPVARSGLEKSSGELQMLVSRHDRIEIQPSMEGFRVEVGSGESAATFIIGGATPQAADRRWRLATRCAATVQAAIQGGVCPGGGTAELDAVGRINSLAGQDVTDHVGLDCLTEALREPIIAIATNAGHTAEAALETAQTAEGQKPGVINCRSGDDRDDKDIYDSAPVKIAAIRGAVQIAGRLMQTGRLYE